MPTKLANIETLLCPICQGEIGEELLERLKLEAEDLTRIREFLEEKSLMQILELGDIASKYLTPDTLGIEYQVKESLRKLSEKATQLMDKHRELSNELVKASEEKNEQVTEGELKKQKKHSTN